VQQYAEEKWLPSRIGELKPRTHDHYAQVFRDYIYPTLGNIPLRELTRPLLKTWLSQVRRLKGRKHADSLSAVLSRETLKNLVIPLRAMLNDAQDDGLIPSNPAVRLLKRTRGLTEKDARRVEAYTKDELRLILATADARCPEWADFFRVLGWTGLRLGEACALQWADLDAVGGFLTIYRTAQYRKLHGTVQLLVGAPKSGKGRKVDTPQELVDKLILRRGIMEAEASLNAQEPSPWIFPAPSDSTKPVDAAFVRYKRWYRLVQVAGLRSLKLHALRHTYASLLLQDGESPTYVKEQMGHSSIQVTVDVYGHFIPGKNRGAVERLAAATSSGKEPVLAHDNLDKTKTLRAASEPSAVTA
jgi:integrase